MPRLSDGERIHAALAHLAQTVRAVATIHSAIGRMDGCEVYEPADAYDGVFGTPACYRAPVPPSWADEAEVCEACAPRVLLMRASRDARKARTAARRRVERWALRLADQEVAC